MKAVRGYLKTTDKTYLFLCMGCSIFAVIVLLSVGRYYAGGFSYDSLTGARGLGGYKYALVQAGAFVLGLGMAFIEGDTLKKAMYDFRAIIYKVISAVIIPLLPLYIFGIFLNMTSAGQVAAVLAVFAKIIILIFIITLVVLLIQFGIAGAVSGQNPLKMLGTMLPAYFTALGTSSSAATIPVTYKQVQALGVREDIAGFTVPLCANIHMSGSTIKITACAMAIVLLTGGELHFWQFAGFICMLGISIMAGPGVPGGAVMASLGVLQKMLGFNEEMLGLMIALYIAMDSFGTACNVTGDGAVSVIVNKIYQQECEK